MKDNSVGIVKPQTVQIDKPLKLKRGGTLPAFKLVYETYGKLNAKRNNAILICHALSGNHHAAGFHSKGDDKPGWWDALIGPGKAIDTNTFFVVALNNLGGCHGSSGPNQTNPQTGKPYGGDFPQVVVEDWVASQAALSDHLGIKCWAAVVGGSLGGMQALQWAISEPTRLKSALIIAATSKLHPQNIAFNKIARQAIEKDPDFAAGDYLQQNKKPIRGLWLARMLGHITYLSEEAIMQKFGRNIRQDIKDISADGLTENPARFEVESYLDHQGEKFAESFDANTYLLMTRVLDYFDPAASYNGDLTKAIAKSDCSFLVVSFSTDWRFSSANSHEMVDAMIKGDKRVCYAEIDTRHGHDSFLMDLPEYVQLVKKFLGNLAAEQGI